MKPRRKASEDMWGDSADLTKCVMGYQLYDVYVKEGGGDPKGGMMTPFLYYGDE